MKPTGPHERRAFGYDLYSIIGEDMFENAVLLTALAEKQMPWGQVSFACKMGCRAAARIALALRTFSELTQADIGREIISQYGNSSVSLKKVLGMLVHHQKIEIIVDPPMYRILVSSQRLATRDQTLHRLTELIVTSDKGEVKVGLKALTDALADEIQVQIDTPEARVLKEAQIGRSR